MLDPCKQNHAEAAHLHDGKGTDSLKTIELIRQKPGRIKPDQKAKLRRKPDSKHPQKCRARQNQNNGPNHAKSRHDGTNRPENLGNQMKTGDRIGIGANLVRNKKTTNQPDQRGKNDINRANPTANFECECQALCLPPKCNEPRATSPDCCTSIKQNFLWSNPDQTETGRKLAPFPLKTHLRDPAPDVADLPELP